MALVLYAWKTEQMCLKSEIGVTAQSLVGPILQGMGKAKCFVSVCLSPEDSFSLVTHSYLFPVAANNFLVRRTSTFSRVLIRWVKVLSTSTIEAKVSLNK